MPVLVEVIHMQTRDWQRCMQELCWICGSICVHISVQKRERMLKPGNCIIWQLCSDMYSPDLAIYFKRHRGILFWDPVGPPTVHGAQLFGWGFFYVFFVFSNKL